MNPASAPHSVSPSPDLADSDFNVVAVLISYSEDCEAVEIRRGPQLVTKGSAVQEDKSALNRKVAERLRTPQNSWGIN